MLPSLIVIPAMLLILLTGIQANGRAENVIVGGFSDSDPARGLPAHWEKMAFSNIQRQTSYALVRDHGQTVIQAVSNASASGLIRYFNGSAQMLPWISWRWKIDHVLTKGDLSSKQGDDYAARIYVAFEFSAAGKSWWQKVRYGAANLASGGKLPGSALSYIWANKAPRETIASSPYADQAKMIVLQSGNALTGQWIVERRNLIQDYQAAFGQKPPPIMGIAIMTDTDNTGESTTAYYGDILLSDK